MLSLVILFLSIGGILSEEDGDTPRNIYDECKIDDDKHFQMTHVVEREELLEKCPTLVEYRQCLLEKMEENDYSEGFITEGQQLHNFFSEVCNENSEMHQDYIASVPCFKTLEDDAKTCYNYAKDVYRRNYHLINHDEPEDLDDGWIQIDAMCLLNSITVGCLSQKVNEKCGKAAYTTMTNMVKESWYLNSYCSQNVKNILETSLLSNLDLDDDTKDFYKNIFNDIRQ